MYTHSRTVPVSSMFILKLKPYKLYAHRAFCQRVTSPMTSSPTYEVDLPTSNVSSLTQGHFYPYTHINYSSFFIQHRAKQTAKYVYPELNAIQLIPRSFIQCRAKRKGILDIGSQSDWHISVGDLTFDVGESTSYVGELTRWRNDRYSWRDTDAVNGREYSMKGFRKVNSHCVDLRPNVLKQESF